MLCETLVINFLNKEASGSSRKDYLAYADVHSPSALTAQTSQDDQLENLGNFPQLRWCGCGLLVDHYIGLAPGQSSSGAVAILEDVIFRLAITDAVIVIS